MTASSSWAATITATRGSSSARRTRRGRTRAASGWGAATTPARGGSPGARPPRGARTRAAAAAATGYAAWVHTSAPSDAQNTTFTASTTRQSTETPGVSGRLEPVPGPVCFVVGARPNFMKAAPVLRALERSGTPTLLVHTGQHYDAAMSDVFIEQLGLPLPDVFLGVGSGTHAEQTARALVGVEG